MRLSWIFSNHAPPGEMHSQQAEDAVMPADIRRDSYLRRLISLQGPDIIKIITGIRGCGKTYLLFTQFRNYLLCSGIDESMRSACSVSLRQC